MYKRILIPMDGTQEAENVLPVVKDELAPDGEIILIKVIPPAKTQVVGGQTLLGSQIDETERSKAESYLRNVIRSMDGESERCHSEVIFSNSIPGGILNSAQQHEADLIAMYTHDRKGLSAIFKKSIAKNVAKNAPVEVKVFTPRELAIAS